MKDWQVYSAGISNDAEVHVSVEDIEWADVIFVMEKIHKKKLSSKFGPAIKDQRVISLDIPDDYGYMDEKLIEILESKVPEYFAIPGLTRRSITGLPAGYIPGAG